MGRQGIDNTKKNKAQGINNPMSKAKTGRLYSIKQASEFLGLPVWCVRTLVWNGFPHLKIGHTFYLDRIDMDAWIEKQKRTISV